MTKKTIWSIAVIMGFSFLALIFLQLKYIQQMAEKIRPEGGSGEPGLRYGDNSGAFDQLGWCTLMLYK